MKINWFSPLLPAKTDIAHYSMRVIPSLSERASVTVWTDQQSWNREFEQFAQIRRFDSKALDFRELNRADATFFHLGNNVLFHGGIWEAALAHPGIAVLHDCRFHHFFVEYFCSIGNRPHLYFNEIEKQYGARARAEAETLLKRRLQGIDAMAEVYPMTSLALRNSLAAIVHSKEIFDLIKADDELPVAYAPLPFAAQSRSRGPNIAPQSDHRRLILFGYLAPNRRVEQILQAISEIPESNLFILDIYGELWDRKHVESLIARYRLSDQVKIHGFVSESELDTAIAAADLSLNLRNPSMGEASGSQLRCWANETASMVSRTGWYATLPEDTVLFVRPEFEIDDIKRNLRVLIGERQTIAALGRKGHNLLVREHSPQDYAEHLISVAGRLPAIRAKASAEILSKRAGIALGQIGAQSCFESLSGRAGEQILATLAPPRRKADSQAETSNSIERQKIGV